METHTIGIENFLVFEKWDKESLLLVHFIWGKKDFRFYLARNNSGASPKETPAVLVSESGREFVFSRLQYLYNFEWYDFDKVSGHGLAHDEVRWKKGKSIRYVELPKDFLEVALEIAAREFALKRKAPAVAGFC